MYTFEKSEFSSDRTSEYLPVMILGTYKASCVIFLNRDGCRKYIKDSVFGVSDQTPV